MKGYFYITKNLINGKFYYGSGTVGNESSYYGSNKHLNDSRKLYGDDNFEHIPLKYFETREEAYLFEDRFLKLYNIAKNPMSYNQKNEAKGGRTWQDFDDDKKEIVLDKISRKSKEAHKNSEKLKIHVYNMCKMKTKGRLDLPHTEESKRKIRESNIETWKDPELREIQSKKSIELNENGIIGMKGKKHKPESIEKIRKSNTGKTPSNEVRKIISERTKEGMLNMSEERRKEITNKANSNRAANMESKKENLKKLIDENVGISRDELFSISGYTHKTFLGLINKIKLEDEKYTNI
jgi:hypothetical protein